ncbi:DUF427 domain-containing protein [Mesorhizobium sp. NBSH29]|uniref:DUF427 domain-containing protein n=1 Tax=Mesorhizobium sp. NBSH29 TaxID=2654249 RepID=UPI0018964C7F|nr:DUF427 domain-containing protein [Mesorhizobium sp. NBSH29]QPC87049.1 DUF427 domain-containing protein [Mesorhizobium sp. NBSH29]
MTPLAANPSPGFQRNPTRRINVTAFDGVVTVSFAGAIIASSASALVLQEEDYLPVFYIPFSDIYFEFLTPTETSTHCPYKGDASYWNATASGEAARNVMWSYEDPYDEMSGISGHGAFYPELVQIEATKN